MQLQNVNEGHPTIYMPHMSGNIGELGYLAKYGKNIKREKLQTTCFQSQVLEFYA
jgi:hypothetical protein